MSLVLPSGIAPLRFYLLAESSVTDLVGQRVFGEVIPPQEAQYMPRGTLVLGSGGYGSTEGSAGQTSTIVTPRIDARCYGADAADSDLLDKAVYLAMHQMRRCTVGDARIYATMHVEGPRYAVDPETDWNYVVRTYLLRMDNREVT